jgi:hypothetical protein
VPKIESMEDVSAWVNEHDGRIGAWWEAQRDWNDANDRVHSEIIELVKQSKHHTTTEVNSCASKVSSLERRVIYAAGFASAAGAIGAILLQSFVLR